MGILYDFALIVYSFVVKMVAPFNPKAKFWSDGRKNIFRRLEADFKDNGAPIAWFHAASLGEFEQGRAVIELFKAKNPSFKILLTFYSPSGYEVRKNYDGADYIYYLPIDTKRNAHRFIAITKPEIAVFIKYEFWVNFLKELNRKGVKSYVISAIFRENQLFFKPYGKLYLKVLKYFSHLFVQENGSKELLAAVGISKVTVCGDTRFDRVYQIATQNEEIALFKKFAANSKVFICGSSWGEDDAITISLLDKFRDIKFIIAPHELPEAKIAKIQSSIEQCNRSVVRYTKLEKGCEDCNADVIIVDTIGILSKIYRYATYAYIGGGFGVGIHNTLEAATFGLPMIFGPNYKKFAEAVKLTELGVATPISDKLAAEKWLEELHGNEKLYNSKKEECQKFIKSNIGAGEKIVSTINGELNR